MFYVLLVLREDARVQHGRVEGQLRVSTIWAPPSALGQPAASSAPMRSTLSSADAVGGGRGTDKAISSNENPDGLEQMFLLVSADVVRRTAAGGHVSQPRLAIPQSR